MRDQTVHPDLGMRRLSVLVGEDVIHALNIEAAKRRMPSRALADLLLANALGVHREGPLFVRSHRIQAIPA